MGQGGAWHERLKGQRPSGLLEVAVFPGRIELVEHYRDDGSERLLAALRQLGLKAEADFRSPCG